MRQLSPIVAVLLVVALVIVARFVPLGGSESDPTKPPEPAARGDYPTHGCDHARELPDRDSPGRAASATLCLLNAERRAHGRAPFRREAALTAAAEEHARDMVERRFFEHENPEGESPAMRIARAGYPRAATTGENLGYGTAAAGSPAAIVDGWMHSPGHRRNILRSAFAEIGIGVVARPVDADGRGGTYVTTFGGVAGPA
jgi:uncharacterized protein YkwD